MQTGLTHIKVIPGTAVRGNSMTNAAIKLALIAAAFLAATPASMAADAAKGAQLAQQWCANCHVVDGSVPPSVQQGPPNFTVVARDVTSEKMRTFLSHPHPPMPDLSLSRSEIDDLIAFIDTLR